MNTCGTCRYWGDDDDKGHRFRKCLGVYSCQEFSGPGDAERVQRKIDNPDHIDWHNTELTQVVKERAYTIDGSGYYNALKCREDFGCVLHQEK